MTYETTGLKQCIIITQDKSDLIETYETEEDSRFKLKYLSGLVRGGGLEFKEPGEALQVDDDFCLFIEDEYDNAAQLIHAVASSGIISSMVVCRDMASCAHLSAQVSKKPLFVGFDFKITNAENWHVDTNILYDNLKLKWPGIPFFGITHFESDTTNADALLLADKFRKNGDNVYNKSTVWDALPNIFKDTCIIRLHAIVAEQNQVIAKLEKANKVRDNALGPDFLEKPDHEAFQGLERRILGNSSKMKEIRKHIEIFAKVSHNILIVGETGTGKELVARAIHALSDPKQAFIAINCAALPDGLVESELFGVKEDYPGFHNKKRLVGAFEKAEGGIIFFDELHRMSMTAQAKLLRVIEEKEYTPLGESPVKIGKIRIIAAIKPDPEKLIENNQFLDDLYGRLNSFMPVLPPLRERQEDMEELWDLFIEEWAPVGKIPSIIFSEKAKETIRQQPWKRNVRELRNFIFNLCTLYTSFKSGLINLNEDHIVYALNLHNKTKPDDELVKKILDSQPTAITAAMQTKEKAAARKWFKQFLDAMAKCPGTGELKQPAIANEMVTSKGRKGIAKETASSDFTKHKKFFKELMGEPEFMAMVDVAMRYPTLAKIIGA